MTSLANAFDPSMPQPQPVGPKAAMPVGSQLVGDAGDQRRLGPTTTRSTPLSRATAATAAPSVTSTWRVRPTCAVPGLPGRH
jgi:hypothetical protein